MKTIIVDDERLAREELRALLAEHESVEVCGEAANATSAIRLIQELHPDLMFLDIEMPGMNGFQLIEALPAPHPQIIFVTAYDAFALRAFEVNALDYLMKPVNPRRLVEALNKLQTRAENNNNDDEADEAPATPLTEEDRIFVRDGERCWFVPLRELKLLETEGNYTRLHMKSGSPLLYRTLNSLEQRLPESLFIRANRSQIVNLHKIEGVSPWFSGGLKATLCDGKEVEFSRRQARAFRNKTGL